MAFYPMEKFRPEILQFIREYVFEKKPQMVDINYFDPNQESKFTLSPRICIGKSSYLATFKQALFYYLCKI